MSFQEGKVFYNLIEVYIMNKLYMVPEGVTIMQAFEYSGFRFIRGCGCRGGVCGACSVFYRLPDSNTIQTGLACQTVVQRNMSLVQSAFFPMNKALYDLGELSPKTKQILEIYPDILKCMGCNTCTKSCPMDINVMDVLSELLRGAIEKVADLSTSCIMCGLCATRCPVGLTPHYYFLLCRRIYGKHIMVPFVSVPDRISEIENKEYEEELDRLMALDLDSLKEVYRDFQADKQEYRDPLDGGAARKRK